MFGIKKRQEDYRERLKSLIREGISIFGFINPAYPDYVKYTQYLDHIKSSVNGDYDANDIVPDVRGMIECLAGDAKASEAYKLFKKTSDKELAEMLGDMKPEIQECFITMTKLW